MSLNRHLYFLGPVFGGRDHKALVRNVYQDIGYNRVFSVFFLKGA